MRSDFVVGLLSAIPYAVAAVGMVIVGRHSDRTGERRWHIALAAIIGGVSFALTGFVHGTVPSLVTLSMAMFGLASMLGPFWAFATSFLGGIGAAAGIALVNSVGNIGGFVGPNIIGYVQQTTSSFSTGLVIIGGVLACGGLLGTRGETMNNLDFVIYGVHTVFWWAFVISRWIVTRSAGKTVDTWRACDPGDVVQRGRAHSPVVARVDRIPLRCVRDDVYRYRLRGVGKASAVLVWGATDRRNRSDLDRRRAHRVGGTSFPLVALSRRC